MKVLFSALFGVSLLQDVSIASMGGWKNGAWTWGDFGVPLWRLQKHDYVAEILLLQQLLCCQQPSSGCSDGVLWKNGKDGDFTVSNCYSIIASLRIPAGPVERYDYAFGLVWRQHVPHKVKAFGWRRFINILLSKVLLAKRGLGTLSNALCVYFQCIDETSIHSLLLCNHVDLVLKDMAEWIGFSDYRALYFKGSFCFWANFCKRMKVRKGKERVI